MHARSNEPARTAEDAERARAAAQDPMYRALASMYHALCLAFGARWGEAARICALALLPLLRRVRVDPIKRLADAPPTVHAE